MDQYPAFINLRQRHSVVIGGGVIAERKAQTLLDAGSKVLIVAPEVTASIQQWANEGLITLHLRHYEQGDIDHVLVVIVATSDTVLNAEIAKQADEQNTLVNVVDNPALCSYIMPSIVDRSPVTIAVSTGGASPVLARQLRMKLETLIPSSCGYLAGITEEYREQVKQRFATVEERKLFWESALRGSFAELVYAGRLNDARTLLEQLIQQGNARSEVGEVYLVGAGPGDPDLLTFRALRLMQQADVMVFDRLVSKTILDMANRNAERIYVGKEKDNHAVPQNKINDLLVDLALQGKRVLRLKGGDPFIFGRGGEEIETLAEKKIPFQVVPAVTAAAGCASYAGIPLTHRDYAQSVSFATGHLKDGSINLNWQQLVQPNHTIVFYMGLTGIKVISKQLQAHGMAGDMPAALIEQGTTSNQRVHIGTVANLPELVKTSGVRAPTLTIIGNVVKLHETLNWYEPKRHVAATEFSKND
ncbi:MAG: uroporphyrinogen-III C-methyltransferase [Thiotrichaceae bacterium]|nr:uroporphyrinogen-III C-methyltransferase [Thiotrichaceae bacterium]